MNIYCPDNYRLQSNMSDQAFTANESEPILTSIEAHTFFNSYSVVMQDLKGLKPNSIPSRQGWNHLAKENYS